MVKFAKQCLRLRKNKKKKKRKGKEKKKTPQTSPDSSLEQRYQPNNNIKVFFCGFSCTTMERKKKKGWGGAATIDIRSPNSVRETEGERSETGTQRHRERERVFVFLLWGVGSTHFH